MTVDFLKRLTYYVLVASCAGLIIFGLSGLASCVSIIIHHWSRP